MLNVDIFLRRLAQYGAAWLGSFFLVLAGALVLRLAGLSLAKACDLMLSAAFVALAVAWIGVVVITLISRENLVTKAALTIVALALLIPLLWAPVLGAILTAWIAHAEIEYSQVYAQFRIVLGDVLYVGTKLIFGNPLVDAAMAFFRGLATFVGFIAAVAQLWQTFVPRRRAEAEG